MARMAKDRTFGRAEGERLAALAFAFLAEEPARIGRFLALTGHDPADLRDLAGTPAFLAGVLDHVLQDETLLLAFSAEARIDPAGVARARRGLGEA